MGHVFKTKLDVENFQWLTSLIKVHKETLHKVAASTDGPHDQIKFLKREIKQKRYRSKFEIKI